MYATTKENSPQTWLTVDLAIDGTTMTVDSATPLETAPNIVTLGEGQDAELVRYLTAPSGLTFTIERGFNGTTARAWDAGTAVYRAPTAYDMNTHRIAASYAYASLLGAM